MATSESQKQRQHTSEEPPPTLCLHDSLALGEVQVGLLAEKQAGSELEEIKRLPVLLRLLSASRPLATIPSFQETNNKEEEGEDLPTTDQLANQVVAQLEDVAATYSVAEGADVVACHLAPTICRNISKLPPLKPKKRRSIMMLMSSSSTTITTTKGSNRGGGLDTSMGWETSELMAVGANPRSSFKRRRISQTETTTTTATPNTWLRDQADPADELNIEGNAGAFSEGVVSSDDEEQVTEMATAAAGAVQKARPSPRRSSEPHAGGRAAEDSQEEMVAKTLSDLTALVVSALQPIKIDFEATTKTGNSNKNNSHNKSGSHNNSNNKNDDGNGQQQQHHDFNDDKDTSRRGGGGKLALAVDDSTLSEPARSRVAADSVRGVMTGTDLGSTIASLMHHAPVLRHEHVANALCRASVPQAADLIQRMGANCPSAVPSLLRGCIEAYKSAILLMNSRHNSTVATAAKSATQALAELSEREKSRVRTVLQQEEVMVDVQLKLAISQDPLAAVCLLLQHLSLPLTDDEATPETNEMTGESIQPKPVSRNRNDSKMRSNGYRKTLCDVSLKILFKETPNLLVTAVSLVKKELSTLVANTEGDLLLKNDFGRVCLLLRCYAWSSLHFDVMKALHGRNSSNEGASLLSVLQEVVDKSRRAIHFGDGDSFSTKGPNKGIPLSLSFCGSILTLARLLISTDEADKQLVESCEAWVKSCFDSRTSNAEYGTLVTRFAFALKTKNINICITLLLNVLRGDLCSAADVLCLTPQLQEGLSKVCSWVMGNDEVDNLINEAISLPATTINDPTPLLDFICYSHDPPEGLTEKIKTALRQVLCGTPSRTMAGLEHAHVPGFIVKATGYLAKNSDLRIPVLSPLELESRATKMDLRRLDCLVSVDSAECNFLYQVLYWLAYIDADASAMFTFDTRNLPLKEVLRCSRILWAITSRQSLSTHLENLISKHFPEIPLQFRRWEVVKQFARPYSAGTQTSLDRTRIKRNLCSALKASLTGTDATDRSAAFAEKAFLVARAELTDSELCTQTVSALLSTPSSPPPFCTYSMLCRDPLILLKTPMCAWQCHGLRRIVLSVLNSLLETNEATAEMSSPTDSCTEELITSRNLLVLRSALLAVSGSQEGKSEHTAYFCSMTTHFMRLLVANNPGLIGLLVKQSPALPDCSMDYLVEFVPETMDDAESLINVFNERGSVTARLTAAAAILRIAIAHGNRDEATAEHLVYAALAQLVSSFFLVIGPVGVPVNVLLSDDGSGQLDVTQTARRLCFRMLRSLLNVRGRQRPRLRNECGMALHKLAGLCKGENILSGVAGAVVSRRKVLLREMFEAVTKAANSMGSGIDL